MSVAVKKQRNFPPAGRDAVSGLAEELVARLPALATATATTKNIAAVLHELLEGRDERSRKMRTGMQHYLIEVAEAQAEATGASAADTMLTTEQAADLMQCSRPYVAMLIDNHKLAGASVTQGGHRRVPESSVRHWINERRAAPPQADYRTAATEGDMYEIPEQAYIEATRRRP